MADPASEQPAGEGAAEATPPPNEMRAINLTGYGGIRMVKVQKKPEVSAKEGQVVVRVKACGLNFSDLVVRQGAIENPPKIPFVMGFECAGEIDSLGENVEGFKVGDRVLALTDYNAWAELVAVPATHIYKMPDSMSFQDGSALLMNYLTAYMLLFEHGNLHAGQSVLVHSVGGGVGHAVCHLCKTVENVTIFGTASYNKLDAIKNNVTHLFDHVVDYCQEIRKISPEGVDMVLDCLSGEDTNRGINILKPMGRYILYGSSNIVTGETKSFFSLAKSWWQVDKISPLKLYDENKIICGLNLRHLLFSQGQHEYIRTIVNKLFALYGSGKIRPHIDTAYAFEDVGEAMQKMHNRENIGKIILDPSIEAKPKDDPVKFNLTLITLQNTGSPGEGSVSDDKEAKKEGE